VLTVDSQTQLEELLVSSKLISQKDLLVHKKKAAEQHRPLLSYLTEEKLIDTEGLTKVVAKANSVPYVRLTDTSLNQDVLKLLPRDIAERYMAVPLGNIEGRLAVAMLDANNVQAVDFLAKKIDRPLKVYMASEEGIRHILAQYSSDLGTDVSAAFAGGEAAETAAEGKDAQPKKQTIKTIVQDSPISRALTAILEYAVQSRASDIHIEPRQEDLKIRARVDGILQEIMVLPKSIEPALVSRIKILSTLKIDEHRTPQDGQFQIEAAGREIDLRIAISPVVWGEQVVIRILDKTGTLLDLGNHGVYGDTLERIRSGIHRPHGMVLSSGPTGSGKSTTLYALINEIKSDEINIVTLEDPVEYKMSGVNQIQVNTEVGLTFASGLRSILRQDPDVVMVGEIRDKETANLAVQAALTGHLVFSTLHTNSAAGVLPRLLDMGVEPFLIASTVNTVIGQRLVRRLTDEKQSRPANKAEIAAINEVLGAILPTDPKQQAALKKTLGYENLPLKSENAYTLYDGKVTKTTPKGYQGRIGIYESFTISEKIEELIVGRATSSAIQDQAQKEGMITMRQDGYLKVLNGVTTLEEVNRVAAES
jgi:type IV pilus assembly protein PilB